jgi:hypothetical protein
MSICILKIVWTLTHANTAAAEWTAFSTTSALAV